MPSDAGPVHLSYQVPSVTEYLKLRKDGGLSAFSEEAARIGLEGTFFAVTLRLEDEAIGMGRVVGDGGCFVQIVEIVVDPRHRGKGFGKMIMGALMDHVRKTLPETTFVSLLADPPADKLYAQFGFKETAPASLGMSCRVTRT